MEWLEGIDGKVGLAYDSGDVNVFGEWASGCLVAHSLERQIPLYSDNVSGKPTIEVSKLIELAKTFGQVGFTYSRHGKNNFHYIFLSKDGILTLMNGFESGKVSVNVLTRTPKELEFFKEKLAPIFVDMPDGDVYVISRGPKGPRLESIGVAHIALERGNYEDNVVKSYDYIVKDLNNKKNPGGRLSIIDGQPGTGKTYLVRALMGEVPNAIFVIVPPESVMEISGPNLIPLLNETRAHSIEGDRDRRSIVLILEDADDILVPRGRDNMSAISALLNYTAGIFGDLFDLRIIATTNAKKVELEKALLRSGRLSRAITVGELSAEKATQVYRRLTGNQTFILEKPQTLADVYALSKGIERQEDREEEKLGFLK